jgi:adenylosuccinate lyase
MPDELAMFDRHAERLAQLSPRVPVGQLSGATSTGGWFGSTRKGI